MTTTSKSYQAINTEHPLTLVYQIPVGRTSTFWEKLREGKIVAPRCRRCSSLYFPPQADCPGCLASDMEWVELSSEGTLETYTHVMVGPGSFSKETPYTVAVGRLKEDVAVLAWLKGVEYGKLKIGMKLTLNIRKAGEDKFIYEWGPGR